MDTVSNLLDIVRARGAVYFGKIVSPHFGMEIDRRPGFWRFHLVLAGSTWIRLTDGSSSTKLAAGDLVIVPRGAAHILSDDEGGSATSTHHVPDDVPVPQFESRHPMPGETHLLCGYYQFALGSPLAILEQIPGLLVLRNGAGPAARSVALAVDIIRREAASGSAAPRVVLNRLSEVIFYYAVRQWFRDALSPNGPLSALGDPHIQRALATIHASPERRWTVEDLARIAGHSRASFSNHFHAATGYSPIRYLTLWRVELARRMLADTTLSLTDIACRIGYVDTNAFSRAFARISGMAPGAYRRAANRQP